MYCLKLYRAAGLAKIVMAGDVLEDEMLAIGRDLERTLLTEPGTVAGLLIDLQQAKPPTANVSTILRELEERTFETTTVRIAELVESELIAGQLGRVAESTSGGERLKHFWQLEPALAWLAEPDGDAS